MWTLVTTPPVRLSFLYIPSRETNLTLPQTARRSWSSRLALGVLWGLLWDIHLYSLFRSHMQHMIIPCRFVEFSVWFLRILCALLIIIITVLCRKNDLVSFQVPVFHQIYVSRQTRGCPRRKTLPWRRFRGAQRTHFRKQQLPWCPLRQLNKIRRKHHQPSQITVTGSVQRASSFKTMLKYYQNNCVWQPWYVLQKPISNDSNITSRPSKLSKPCIRNVPSVCLSMKNQANMSKCNCNCKIT